MLDPCADHHLELDQFAVSRIEVSFCRLFRTIKGIARGESKGVCDPPPPSKPLFVTLSKTQHVS